LEGTCRVHDAVGRQSASAWPEYEDENEDEDEGEGEEAERGDVGEDEAAVAAVVEDDDPRGPEGARTIAVSAADTDSKGEDEAAGWRLGRVWDEAAIHRGVILLLTMMGQSTGEVAWYRAALGPWLGVFIHACTKKSR